MVAEARAEREELAAAKAAAEQHAAELESALSAALSDLEAAKVGRVVWEGACWPSTPKLVH